MNLTNKQIIRALVVVSVMDDLRPWNQVAKSKIDRRLVLQRIFAVLEKPIKLKKI